MRATRLINILTTLQARGLVTAEVLAAENAVSVRTIYRDIDALSLAGVPVYAERGSEGGYRLLDGYRVRLNGFSAEEAQAVFLTGLQGPAADLGLGAIFASAEKKLAAALPDHMRASAALLRDRFHLDAPGWYNDADRPEHLQPVVEAVMASRRIAMRYRSWTAEKHREVNPLGVVIKGGQWYLAGGVDGEVRTYRIARILDLAVLDETFARPESFDLAAWWRGTVERMERETHPLTVRLRVSEMGLAFLKHFAQPYAVSRIVEEGEPDAGGWRTVSMPSESLFSSASFFLRLGPEAEVLEPPELRAKMIDWLARTAALYQPAP